MSTTSNPDTSVRPTHGTITQRQPRTGKIVTIYPDGRRVVEPEDTTPVTRWPNDQVKPRPSK